MPTADRLTAIQRHVLRSVLARYADHIKRVDLYGSRARGTHRPGSDVDLLIHGTMTGRELGRLISDLEESDLSLHVDVKLGGQLSDNTFRQTALAEAITLFDRADLFAAA